MKQAQEKMVDDLLALAPHLEKRDHTPGRITVKLKWSALALVDKIDLKGMQREIPGISEASISKLKRTATISYDPDKIPFDLWERLIASAKDQDRRAELKRELQVLMS